MLNHRAKMPARGQGIGVPREKVVCCERCDRGPGVVGAGASGRHGADSHGPGPIALPFDWEGFYVGAHTGAVTNDVSFTQTNVTWSGSVGGQSQSRIPA